jgi:carbon-monoxide dehydrogenase medium subunit
MPESIPEWLAPTTLEEALELRARYGDDATVVAGGTFIGILMSQRLIMPAAFLSLRNIQSLSFIEKQIGQGMPHLLRIGAMTTHRELERSTVIRSEWSSLAHTFSLVASPRVRNQATVGGVLADADYASDPPAMLHAFDARVVVKKKDGNARQIPVEELITGYYETSLQPDELLTEIHIPYAVERSVYRKFRSRSSEDRPCVAIAVTQIGGKLRVVVGAVAERPQYFPSICSLADGEVLNSELAAEIGRRYAESIDPISDARGSSAYRRRVIAVEVRRALEDLMAIGVQEERRTASE